MKMHAGFALLTLLALVAIAALPAGAQEAAPDQKDLIIIADPLMPAPPQSPPEAPGDRVDMLTNRIPLEIPPVPPGECTPSNTTAAALEDVILRSTKYGDSCISMLGYFDGLVFAPKRQTVENEVRTGMRREASAGLFGTPDIMKQISSSDSTRARVVGKVRYAVCTVAVTADDLDPTPEWCNIVIGVASFHPLR
jgi:hypothetical protein